MLFIKNDKVLFAQGYFYYIVGNFKCSQEYQQVELRKPCS